jgi:hypothetical protein
MLYRLESHTMARACTDEDLKRLHAKRADAIRKAGTKWLLHPANAVKRRTPMPRAVVCLVAMFLIGGIGNDYDGHTPYPRAEAVP